MQNSRLYKNAQLQQVELLMHMNIKIANNTLAIVISLKNTTKSWYETAREKEQSRFQQS